MSEAAEAAPKKKGGKGKMMIMLVVAVLMGGGGAVGGLYAAGAFTHAEEGPKEDPNMPRLVPAGEEPEAVAAKYAPPKGEHGEGGGGESADAHGAGHGHKLPKGGIDLPRPKNIADYHATYFQLPTPFTSNLIDTDSFMQISIAVSTYYDSRVVEALKTHEMAMRSAVLLALSQEAEANLSTPEGKGVLQRKLTKLLNKVLKEKTGYGGIDNVYFTNFVIQ